jgi:hypothetical protein
MQGSDDFPSRPTRWHRLASNSPADARKDMAGMLGQELQHVFCLTQTASDLEGVRRLLEEIEKKRKCFDRNGHRPSAIARAQSLARST